MSDDLRDAEAAFLRYEAVRARLPAARFPAEPAFARDLGEVADRWDGFVLDAFGVLNVGETPIPGAVARMAELRARGKKLCVLTNAASYTRAEALRKYRNLGFDFS
ncbi:MAG: HAD family hydrolase, partial [Rhodobacteraceae bacterium]|nr:HAD family hydrolase [Paracoccaceae bacterium]